MTDNADKTAIDPDLFSKTALLNEFQSDLLTPFDHVLHVISIVEIEYRYTVRYLGPTDIP